MVYKPSKASITGLNEFNVGQSKGHATLYCASRVYEEKEFIADALVIPKIITTTPETYLKISNWSHIRGLTLADPWFNRPADVDMLLGAEHFWSLLREGKKVDSTGNLPVAQNSDLGWIIGGGSSYPTHSVSNKAMVRSVEGVDSVRPNAEDTLNSLLKRFWEVEAIPDEKILSIEEQKCEEHFIKSVRRADNGRYIVRLPFKTHEVKLGDSMRQAISRLYQVEARLKKNPAHHEEYVKFMDEYESLGHMEEIEPWQAKYFIPHHFVLKASSTTTSFRVVFDASAVTTNGKSLNDFMYIGYQVQEPLLDIILRFRLHKYVISADITKFYRQILVDERDQPYQCIVWRRSPNEKLKFYMLKTVTYGTGAGPYLATRALLELAQNEGDKYPRAKKAILDSFYVDDTMAGAESKEECILLVKELMELLDSARIDIRKFTSNDDEVLRSIPEEKRATQSLLEFEKDPTLKLLGLCYNPLTDCFNFKSNFFTPDKGFATKREVLSDTAKLFDPTGWLAPVVVVPKILMQDIWRLGSGWDDKLPQKFLDRWRKFKQGMGELEDIKIPRYQLFPEVTQNRRYYLFGFCDASEKAYAACVYLGVYDNDMRGKVTLITAKTRVAPVQIQTIPRLELCGAVLLTNLMGKVEKALKLPIVSKVAYTDSSVVLGWIASPACNYERFVAHRISLIQATMGINNWGHVSTDENPADCASKGLTVSELKGFKLWFNGPEGLSKGRIEPIIPDKFNLKVTEGIKRVKTCCMVDTQNSLCLQSQHSRGHERNIFKLFGSMRKLQRVNAWMLRFIRRLKERCSKKGDKPDLESDLAKTTLYIRHGHEVSRIAAPLSVVELRDSLLSLIRCAQMDVYNQEFHELTTHGKLLTVKSKILHLNPFLDKKDGVLRIGGRLRHLKVSDEMRFPILLPPFHELSILLARQAHDSNHHVGPQGLLSYLQQLYWIHRGKDLCRQAIRKCVTCTRFRGEVAEQIMGDLPAHRVNPARPFQLVGVDYAGPITMKPDLSRSKIRIKGYLAVFVCCVTRAIHIEIVQDATTQAFIKCLRRFVARRGKPHNVYSDNGTNFVGANNVLKRLYEAVSHDDVMNHCANEGINWTFIPPSAPHHGGLWEAGVKSVKHHLMRVMKDMVLTYEELLTIVNEIEGILNSRPISPESNDPDDLRALTPGHFLVGQPITLIPEGEISEIKENRLARWQLLCKTVQSFWKRWMPEYILRMQNRPKWKMERPDIETGAMVIIKEDGLSPAHWKLGRVMEVYPGKDSHVRSAKMRVIGGEMVRPITKLCKLPIDVSVHEVADNAVTDSQA